ncbi:MAG: polymer-forming cytoskeletal protein [Anaerolineae bacterium]|nr:polymer-forming cytoskeletal protein [Anaerolineae bacterium]
MTANKPQRRWLIPFSVLTLLVLSTVACGTQRKDVEGFNFRRNYTLDAGERIEGDQVILAQRITLNDQGVITGKVTLIGDEVRLNAQVEDDVVIVADTLTIGDTARIAGDLIMCVKNVEGTDTAQIEGEIKKECNDTSRQSVESVFESSFNSWQTSVFFHLVGTIAGSLLFGALAALSTILFHQPLQNMSRAVQRAPLVTGGIGCLTMLIAIGLTLIYLISLLLILPAVLFPYALIGWLVVAMLSVLGWVALAEPFGKRLFRWLGMKNQPPMIAAAVGGVTLSLLIRVWGLFWFTSWIGFLATAILGSIGLGAVVLTRIGTKPYPAPKPDTTRLQ